MRSQDTKRSSDIHEYRLYVLYIWKYLYRNLFLRSDIRERDAYDCFHPPVPLEKTGRLGDADIDHLQTPQKSNA